MSYPILMFGAGLGTRMGELTATRPKPLVNVAGMPLIDHAIALTDGQNVGPKVVNVHAFADQMRAHLANRDIAISDETGMLLETGGGLRKAMPLLDGSPVVTLNTDAVWHGANPIATLLDAWGPKMEALLLTIPKANAVGHRGQGDFKIDPDGRISRSPDQIYTGLQMIRTDDLMNIAEDHFSMNVLWDRIAARRGLYGVSYAGQWCDVGQPQSIPLAQDMIGFQHV